MKEIIKYIDLYGPKVTLTFNKSYSYKTLLGGILTIITGIVIIIFTTIFSRSLFTKSTFKIISSRNIDTTSSFDVSDLPKLIGFISSDGPIEYDEKIFNINILDYEYLIDEKNNREIKIISKDISYENCEKYSGNETYFINNSFKNYDHYSYQCIKPGQNIKIKGQYGNTASGFRSMIILLNKCNNNTNNYTCYSNEIINKKLIGMKLIFLYLGYNMNHYSFDGKHLYYREYGDYFGMSLEHKKYFSVKVTKNIYKSDESVFLNNKDIKEFFTLSEKNINLDLNELNYKTTKIINEDTIGAIIFNMDDDIIEYNRTFDKITNLFANLGGIYNLIIITFNLITKLITKKMEIIDFVNSIPLKQYKLEEKRKKNFKILKNKRKCFSNAGIKSPDNRINLSGVDKNFKIENNSSYMLINKNKNKLYIGNKILNSNFKNYYPTGNHGKVIMLHDNNSIIERINNIGSNIVWFYLCPFIIIKKCHKFSCLCDLYKSLEENLSIEKIFIIISKWPILETIINEHLNQSKYIINEKDSKSNSVRQICDNKIP